MLTTVQGGDGPTRDVKEAEDAFTFELGMGAMRGYGAKTCADLCQHGVVFRVRPGGSFNDQQRVLPERQMFEAHVPEAKLKGPAVPVCLLFGKQVHGSVGAERETQLCGKVVLPGENRLFLCLSSLRDVARNLAVPAQLRHERGANIPREVAVTGHEQEACQQTKRDRRRHERCAAQHEVRPRSEQTRAFPRCEQREGQIAEQWPMHVRALMVHPGAGDAVEEHMREADDRKEVRPVVCGPA